jgi:hypothetical protein
MTIAEILGLLTVENLIAVVQGLALIVAGASAIAAVTPTPKDDEFIGKILKMVNALALNVGKAKRE